MVAVSLKHSNVCMSDGRLFHVVNGCQSCMDLLRLRLVFVVHRFPMKGKIRTAEMKVNWCVHCHLHVQVWYWESVNIVHYNVLKYSPYFISAKNVVYHTSLSHRKQQKCECC